MKPRIRRVRPYFYGIVCDPLYVCESRECLGFGETPKAAHAEWQKDMPKTAIGRMLNRWFNSF